MKRFLGNVGVWTASWELRVTEGSVVGHGTMQDSEDKWHNGTKEIRVML